MCKKKVTSQDLYQLVFLSKSDSSLASGEVERLLAAIQRQSAPNNAREGITGSMLWAVGYFFQVLEGPIDSLERRFDVIQKDPRHSGCKIIRFQPIDTRTFGEKPLTVAGVLWDPVPGLEAAISQPGTIAEASIGDALVNAIVDSVNGKSFTQSLALG